MAISIQQHNPSVLCRPCRFVSIWKQLLSSDLAFLASTQLLAGTLGFIVRAPQRNGYLECWNYIQKAKTYLSAEYGFCLLELLHMDRANSFSCSEVVPGILKDGAEGRGSLSRTTRDLAVQFTAFWDALCSGQMWIRSSSQDNFWQRNNTEQSNLAVSKAHKSF